MKKHPFIVELVKSTPFIIFIVLVLAITIGVVLLNRKEKAVHLQEDVLYIQPGTAEKK